MRYVVITVLATATLAACNLPFMNRPVTKWEHSAADQDQWELDQAGCASRARRKVNREYGADEIKRYGEDEMIRGFSSHMGRYDAKRRERDLVESCLKRLGYRPAKEAKADN